MNKLRSRLRSLPFNRILAALAAAIVLAVIITAGSYRVAANAALRQAKNLNLSMRLLTLYARSDGRTIFDEDRPTGLTERAEADLYDLSGADGELRLSGWDGDRDAPAAFTYTTGQMVVHFTLGEQTQDDRWTVEYRLPILRYGR